MGDLIQLLPALSDAHGQRPELRFDWVADTAFAEIPGWHPAVDQVIPSAHRDWRRHKTEFLCGNRGRAWLRRLRERRYDRVIDAQGSWKSAVIARLARGPSAGLDGASVREPGAQWLYGERHFVAREQLAITRWRQLLAAVLDYPVPTTAPDFGLAGRVWPDPPAPKRSRRRPRWPEFGRQTVFRRHSTIQIVAPVVGSRGTHPD